MQVDKLAVLVAAVITFFMLANMGIGLYQHLAAPGPSLGPAVVLDYDREQSLPTWFATFLLSCAAVLLTWMARTLRSRGEASGWWAFLAALFFLLSVDEQVALHERAMQPLRDALGTSGAFEYAWVLPGSALVVVLGILFLPFLARLPSRTRRRFVAAGVLYVAGALGGEMLGGLLYTRVAPGLLARLGIVVEETLELAGAGVFVVALAGHIERLGAAPGRRAAEPAKPAEPAISRGQA
jgi:hypothetical protein